ncbi:MAG: hydrogenase formation protein HypD [Candidatus Omnitrophica bacterium]|nr:hydrogenase formation protein HypD [Candidatus Omnitrophota bacterium]
MRYIDEFRNKVLINKVLKEIKRILSDQKINIMEVCGTHTQSFFRFGLNRLLPSQLRLISGPGCPVCVSPQDYIDKAIKLSQDKENIILTFGDMLAVPGRISSLQEQKAKHGNVSIVYSCWEALKVAKNNPKRKIVFLAVGFETTAPAVALTILEAKKLRLKNLFFYSGLKLIPPAIEYLLEDKRLTIDGFLCPGHVSTIIGTKPYEFIPKKYNKACCIAGFEPLDILEGIYLLIKQIITKKPRVANQYRRVVRVNGNPKAKGMILKVFKIVDADWRGLGRIPKSGLRIRSSFCCFDAEKEFGLSRLVFKDYSFKKTRPLKEISPQC